MAIFRNTHDTATIDVGDHDPIEPGETVELSKSDQEDFQTYIERDWLVQGGEDEPEDEEPENDEETEDEQNEGGSDEETPDEPEGSEPETVEDEAFVEQVQGVKYLTEDHAQVIAQDFEDFEDFQENVDQSYLENLSGIGSSKASEAIEQLG